MMEYVVSANNASAGPAHTHDLRNFSYKTHTTASTDPHRMDHIISNACMRCVLMTSYGMRMIRAMRT
ncbi:hypothetical protein SFRURICE_003342, partial [Spodoptera frugiperda]